jgi:hypothetical protein
MSDIALFSIGTIVFFLGATGLVLYGLDTFQNWSATTTGTDEDPHLEQQGTVSDVLSEPETV